MELWLDEETGDYRVSGYDDMATYTDHGVTTLMIDEGTAYTDSSNPQQTPTMARGAEIMNAIVNAEEGASFNAYNTLFESKICYKRLDLRHHLLLTQINIL